MTTPASVARHPIHPMLIPFPIGLLVFSFVADIIYLAGGAAVWQDVARYSIAGGIIGGLAAAIFGFVDFLGLIGKPRRLATAHMALNLTVVILFAISFYLRTQGHEIASGPFFLSLAGIVLAVISGWLGGELVYVHGVGVSTRPETETVIRSPL